MSIPSVNDARRFAKQNSLRRVVILFETDDDRFGYTSYGATKALCESTRKIMDSVFDDIQEKVSADPARYWS